MATATPTELSDKQWELIAPLLPKRSWTGRPRAEDRKTINGILWVLRTGARWADMPRKYGAPSTAHVRLQTWQREGVWESIWRTLLSNLNEKGKLDWEKAHLDGTFIAAKKGEKLSG
jgi:transposase